MLLASCARRTALTKSVRDGISDSDMSRIQYYVSDAILLYEQSDSSKTHIMDGKIVQSSVSGSELVIIRKNTPGVMRRLDRHGNIGISFEAVDGRILDFTVFMGQYRLAADEWKGDTGILHYGGKRYYTDAGHVYLTVKIRQLRYSHSRKRVLPGQVVTKR